MSFLGEGLGNKKIRCCFVYMFFMFTFHILLPNVSIDPPFLTQDFDLCDTPCSYPICLVLG